MWWFRAFGLVIGILCLAACGWRPVDAVRSDGAANTGKLAQIKIELINDRIGQQLRNDLLDRLNPDGRPAQPTYSLIVKLTKTETQVGINQNNTASRSDVLVTADYNLRAIGSNKTLLSGQSRGTNSYSIILNPYSTVVGQQDAVKRTLNAIADDITTRLALYFDRRGEQEQ